MPIAVDAITRKKLVLAKQLFQQGLIYSASEHSMTDRLLAVIVFDLAIETVLKALVVALEPKRTPTDSFPGVLDQCDNLLNKRQLGHLPDRPHVLYVHGLRNDAQHKARCPNEWEVSDCRIYSRDFLRKVLTDIWGLSFDDLSLSDLIVHDRPRQYLATAESALAQEDFEDAVTYAAAGLIWTIGQVKAALVGGELPLMGAVSMLNAHGHPADEWAGRQVLDTLRQLQAIVAQMALGIDPSRHMKFRQIAGGVQLPADGVPFRDHQGQSIGKDEVEFVLAYCTDTVVRIENQVGDLDQPRGFVGW